MGGRRRSARAECGMKNSYSSQVPFLELHPGTRLARFLRKVRIGFRNDRADDLLLKVLQYLAAGTRAVWLLYSNTRLAYRYIPGKLEPEVRSADAGHTFEEPELLPGFSIVLKQIFE